MQTGAAAAWYAFTKHYEGEVPYMYLDTRGLVTVGIGNLIDPVASARALPFQFKARNKLGRQPGQRATQAEIEAEWNHLKNNPQRSVLMQHGHQRCASETNLELSAAHLRALFQSKTSRNETYLRGVYPAFAHWPADAQLAVMSMAWALGPAFHKKWPKFHAACMKGNFDDAANNCTIRNSRRNPAHGILFGNAACVVRNPGFYQASKLYYPTMVLDAIEVRA
jgi:GH24 family phage-related lysozyme (muramidase)